MNNLSLVTKIRLYSMPYCDFKYLKIKKGKFLIYDRKSILLFNKNLSHKELFPFVDEEEIHIIFIKKMSDAKFLCLNNNNIYILTIEPEIKIIKKIRIEKNQPIRYAIELKNGIILAATENSILKIIINDNKDEINEIFRIPDECKLKNKKKMDIHLSFYIYNLPNNDNIILINSYSLGTYHQTEGCVRGIEYYSKNMLFTFNVNKCKIVDYIKIFENESYNRNNYTQLRIIIYNKYIIALNNYNKMYIFNIYDFRLIKELDIHNYKTFSLDRNKIFIYSGRYFDQFTLYDLTDITKIKYRNVGIEYIINCNYLLYNLIIDKFSDDKILFTKDKYIFIIKYI